MKRFLVGTVINALGLWLTTLIVTTISVTPYGGSDLWQRIGTFLIIALVFGLVNAIVAPVIKVIAIPLYILTFGLISFVINGALLIFVAWLSNLIDFGGLAIQGFTNSGLSWEGFGWAILGSFVMSIVSFFTRGVFKAFRIL